MIFHLFDLYKLPFILKKEEEMKENQNSRVEDEIPTFAFPAYRLIIRGLIFTR